MDILPIALAVVAIILIGGLVYLKGSLGRLQESLGGNESVATGQELATLQERLGARDQQLQEIRSDFDGVKAEVTNISIALNHSKAELAAAEKELEQLPVITNERNEARAERDSERTRSAELRAKIAGLESQQKEELKANTDKLHLLQQSEKRLAEQFENLANRIFDEKHEKFAESSKESVENLLKPVRDQLDGFRKKVEDVYDKEAKDRVSLHSEIKHLKELNERMSDETLTLTKALKGDYKAQGNWGEIQLERILEASGLVKGREYEMQVSAHNEDGKRCIPDVIVHLPEKRDVVVDSKVSLVAYDRYHGAESDEERQSAIKEHIASLKGHINQLSQKSYEDLDGVNSLDFVIMFVPIDAALLVALEQDRSLTDAAFSKNVWLVSPMNLVGTLRIIYNIWRFEYQNSNAVEIAKQAGRLHDSFVLFAESLNEVGKHIEKAQEAYDTTRNRLTEGRGNLVGRIQRLEKLGAKAKKSMPTALVEEAELDVELLPPKNDDALVEACA